MTRNKNIIKTNHWNLIKCTNVFCEEGFLEFVSYNKLNPDLNLAICGECNTLYQLSERHNFKELIIKHPDYEKKREAVNKLIKEVEAT